MGDAFKSHLLLDGTYSKVTIICSRTDDLSVTEILKVLPKGHHIEELCTKQLEFEENKEALQKDIDAIKAEYSQQRERINEQSQLINALVQAINKSNGVEALVVVTPRKSRQRSHRATAIQSRGEKYKDKESSKKIQVLIRKKSSVLLKPRKRAKRIVCRQWTHSCDLTRHDTKTASCVQQIKNCERS